MPQRAAAVAAGGGGKKKKGRAPAHQNQYAFRHNPKSKKTDKILASPNVGVCKRCHEKIEWRKKYRKYKPLKQLGKCNLCQKRNVKAAYHTICGDCAVGDKANASVVANTAGSSAASRASDASNTEAAASTAENASKLTDAIEEKDDEKQERSVEALEGQDEPPRHRRVCAICVKEYAIGSSSQDDADDALEEELAGQTGRLKLRERRALERKMERLQQEKKRNRRKKADASAATDEGENVKSNDESNGEEDGQQQSEEEENDAAADDEDDSSIPDCDALEDDEDDPFLKAVGGAEKLLTGEAYQKALLEQDT